MRNWYDNLVRKRILLEIEFCLINQNSWKAIAVLYMMRLYRCLRRQFLNLNKKFQDVRSIQAHTGLNVILSHDDERQHIFINKKQDGTLNEKFYKHYLCDYSSMTFYQFINSYAIQCCGFKTNKFTREFYNILIKVLIF